ncbi:MAG TPA: radical SAM protein [Candidatus Gastranaerophilales bacterium]|nr:radical SAM protein [Candidatus Gastranaerophilales bacterium]
MSYYYRLTTAKSVQYLKTELNFFNRNYSFFNSILKKVSFFFHLLYWQGLFKFYRGIDLLFKKNTNLPFFIHKNKIEIEITTKCSMRCYHCDRSCRQAPSDEMMSVEQIKYFIDESVRENKKWQFIVLIGGEPTLHPDIYEICNLFIDYKLKFSPNTKITISTNGVTPKTKEVLENLPEIIHQENSSKTSNKNSLFYTFNVAPIDIEKYQSPKIDFSRGCSTASTAGSALTRYGYYACGAAASIDRVLGLDIGAKSFKEITEKKYRTQLKLLCGYCGFFKAREDDIYDLEDVSSSWEKIYDDYKNKRPELNLYGISSQETAISEEIREVTPVSANV